MEKLSFCDLQTYSESCLAFLTPINLVWPGLKLIHGVKSRLGDPEYVSVQGPNSNSLLLYHRNVLTDFILRVNAGSE